MINFEFNLAKAQSSQRTQRSGLIFLNNKEVRKVKLYTTTSRSSCLGDLARTLLVINLGVTS